MKKNTFLALALLFSLSVFAQFPRTKVVFEEGTGTW